MGRRAAAKEAAIGGRFEAGKHGGGPEVGVGMGCCGAAKTERDCVATGECGSGEERADGQGAASAAEAGSAGRVKGEIGEHVRSGATAKDSAGDGRHVSDESILLEGLTEVAGWLGKDCRARK